MSDSAGVVLATNTYDEYGIPGTSNMGRFQYTGQLWLPEIGMYYYKARIYSPTLGRFLQTDPIGYADGMNAYAYVGNDPVNYRDPLGLVNEGLSGSGGSGRGSSTDTGGTIIVTGSRFHDECGGTAAIVDCYMARGMGLSLADYRGLTQSRGSTLSAAGTRPASYTARAPRQPRRPSAACIFLLENIGSDPATFLAGVASSVIGNAVGSSVGSAYRAYARGGEVIGSRIVAGESALIGARAGRIGGAVGVLAGAVLGIYFQREIQDLIERVCRNVGL